MPVISDYWTGLDEFFELGSEILVAEDSSKVLRYLERISERERRAIGERARARVLGEHTARRRARSLARYIMALKSGADASLRELYADRRRPLLKGA